jgi:hypothetical protein
VLAKLHDRLLVRPTLVVDKIIVDGDMASVRFHLTGGRGKNGADFSMDNCWVFRLIDGAIAEIWGYYDTGKIIDERRDARAEISLLGALRAQAVLQRQVARLASTSTTSGFSSAPAICSANPETGRSQKSHLPRAFGIFPISTGCSSAAMAQAPRVSSNHDLNHRKNHGCRALVRHRPRNRASASETFLLRSHSVLGTDRTFRTSMAIVLYANATAT